MPDYISSITVDDVIDELRAFILPFMRGGEVVRGQNNRTPLPSDPCAVLTEILRTDLQIPYPRYSAFVAVASLQSATRIDVQIDVYGLVAGDITQAIVAAFRTEWGFDRFSAEVKPLYCSDAHQSPLITGEKQFESRWTVTASLQYNPTVSVPQQYADVADVIIFPPADQVS
jgi:hypothetical protein